MSLTLYLVRHAKSSWHNPKLADFDRPLNDRGQKDAPELGKRLRDSGVRVDAIVSSPALRAISTAKHIANEIGYSRQRIMREPLLYMASPEAMLDVIFALETGANEAMIVGHNPGLTDLANMLTRSSIDNVPTCGVAVIRFSFGEWSDVAPGNGKLISFDYPKKYSLK